MFVVVWHCIGICLAFESKTRQRMKGRTLIAALIFLVTLQMVNGGRLGRRIINTMTDQRDMKDNANDLLDPTKRKGCLDSKCLRCKEMWLMLVNNGRNECYSKCPPGFFTSKSKDQCMKDEKLIKSTEDSQIPQNLPQNLETYLNKNMASADRAIK